MTGKGIAQFFWATAYLGICWYIFFPIYHIPTAPILWCLLAALIYMVGEGVIKAAK